MAKQRQSMSEKYRQKSKENASKGASTILLPDGYEFWKPKKEGSYKLNIIPAVFSQGVRLLDDVDPGDIWPRFVYQVHNNIGADNKKIVCPGTFGKKCPICEQFALLKKNGRSWDDPEVKAAKPSIRNLYNITLQDDDPDLVYIFDTSHAMFGKALDYEIKQLEDDDPGIFFADPDEGCTLLVRFASKKIPNIKDAFFEADRIDFKPRKGKIKKTTLAEAIDFSAEGVLVLLDYDDIAKLYLDMYDADDDDDDQEDERPARSRRRPAPVEDEQENESEESEEETPRRSRRSAAKADNGDDEPTPPRRGRRPAAKDDELEEKPAKKSPKCQYGGKYGQDANELDGCEECDMWEACADLSEEYLKQQKKGK